MNPDYLLIGSMAVTLKNILGSLVFDLGSFDLECESLPSLDTLFTSVLLENTIIGSRYLSLSNT